MLEEAMGVEESELEMARRIAELETALLVYADRKNWTKGKYITWVGSDWDPWEIAQDVLKPLESRSRGVRGEGGEDE